MLHPLPVVDAHPKVPSRVRYWTFTYRAPKHRVVVMTGCARGMGRASTLAAIRQRDEAAKKELKEWLFRNNPSSASRTTTAS